MEAKEERIRKDNIRMNKRWIKKAQRDILECEERIEELNRDIAKYVEHIIKLGEPEE